MLSDVKLQYLTSSGATSGIRNLTHNSVAYDVGDLKRMRHKCKAKPISHRRRRRDKSLVGRGDAVAGSVKVKGKGKVFAYSLPSVGPGADPGVQAVSPQVT